MMRRTFPTVSTLCRQERHLRLHKRLALDQNDAVAHRADEAAINELEELAKQLEVEETTECASCIAFDRKENRTARFPQIQNRDFAEGAYARGPNQGMAWPLEREHH